MMNKNKIIGICATVIGAICSVLSLIFLIKSYGAENYGSGYGMEFWANEDYVAFLIVSVACLIFGIYYLVSKNPGDVINSLALICIFDGTILGFYSLGKLFRQLAKHKGFSGSYFAYAMVGLVVLTAGIVIKVLLNKKKAN